MLGAHPTFNLSLPKRKRHGKGQLVPPEKPKSSNILKSKIRLHVGVIGDQFTQQSTTGILDNNSTGNNYMTISAAVLITWKAP